MGSEAATLVIWLLILALGLVFAGIPVKPVSGQQEHSDTAQPAARRRRRAQAAQTSAARQE